MQTLPGNIASTLTQGTTYLCRIWTLTLDNGEIHRFTDLTSDVVYDGDVYRYDPGIRVSAIVLSSGGQPDNGQIEVAASDDFLTLARIRQGALKNAIFDLWACDWRNPDFYGLIPLFSGGTAELKFNNKGRVSVGLNSEIGNQNRNIGELYSRQCRAQLGDERCKVDIEALKRGFEVAAVYGDGYKFASVNLEDVPENYYQFGHVIWSTGLNATLRDEVKSSRPIPGDSGEVTLSLYPRNPIGLGDTGFVYPGCDFNVATCGVKFQNLNNFRGEPYVPPPSVTIYAGRATDNWKVTQNVPKFLPYLPG